MAVTTTKTTSLKVPFTRSGDYEEIHGQPEDGDIELMQDGNSIWLSPSQAAQLADDLRELLSEMEQEV